MMVRVQSRPKPGLAEELAGRAAEIDDPLERLRYLRTVSSKLKWRLRWRAWTASRSGWIVAAVLAITIAAVLIWQQL
jgi:hypothetical protein